MRRLVVFLLLTRAAVLAADSDFNGRWDIHLTNGPPGGPAWWMEIIGAGTPELKGSFVGFSGGGVNPINDLRIREGELRFSSNRDPISQEYSARLVKTDTGSDLQGEMKTSKETLFWIGKRAPDSDQHDDGSWRAGKTIELFNRQDLQGWHGMRPGRRLGWAVRGGLLASAGAADNLVSDQKFWNFELHAEFLIRPGSNSGIGLRGRYEVQILDDANRISDVHGNGALYGRIAPSTNASKSPGEWQTFDIRLVGREVTVVLNGQKIIDRRHIDGLTAIAFDADEGRPGPIALQGDHGPVDFRQLAITPLIR